MREWKHDDRPALPPGPWNDEPDKVQWIDEATGLDCLIHRSYTSGALCGYVGVPPGHPLHGKGYDEAHELCDIEVHGGLTFADVCQEDAPEGYGICHIPEPGRPADVWWLGFDCAHAWDVTPRWVDDYPPLLLGKQVYRDIDYVKAECASLAGQLAGVTAAA